MYNKKAKAFLYRAARFRNPSRRSQKEECLRPPAGRAPCRATSRSASSIRLALLSGREVCPRLSALDPRGRGERGGWLSG